MDATQTTVHAPSTTISALDSDYSNSHCMDVEHSETTDSGVQLLDSESTEMNASMVISGGFDEAIVTPPEEQHKPIVGEEEAQQSSSPPQAPENSNQQILTKSDIENSNLPVKEEKEKQNSEHEVESQQPLFDDPMISSQCSTFDTTETQIVFRRRPKRQITATNPPKKRVSFHEDILKNTKTDNIHIEHGFITYKNGVRATHSSAASASSSSGRYSWCSTTKATDAGEFHASAEDPDYVIYRNACSEVLDYGKTDIYDGEGEPPRCDNSGVFEYADSENGNHLVAGLYKCQCSDSNSSLESNEGGGDEIDVNSNQVRGNYAKTKSSSCDCLGQRHGAERIINDNCYYSEPNIGTATTVTSVWSKEKKPKSSCLKKTKYTDFTSFDDDEQLQAAKTKSLQTFNIHQKRRISGQAATTTPSPSTVSGNRSLFGSLKNIFSMPLPERGVPEGQEDAQAVNEIIRNDSSEEEEEEVEVVERQRATMPSVQPSPGSKSRSFLSKSFDGGFHENVSPSKKRFIHTVDEQLRKKSTTGGESVEKGSPKRMARSLNSGGGGGSENLVQKKAPQEVYRNKFIVNCESTVFEHTGISYSTEEEEDGATSTTAPKQAEPVPATTSQSYLTEKISKWTNMFRSTTSNVSNVKKQMPPIQPAAIAPVPLLLQQSPLNDNSPIRREGQEPGNAGNDVMECSFASSSNSTMTDVSSLVSTPTTTSSGVAEQTTTSITDGFSKIFGGSTSSTSSPGHQQQQQQQQQQNVNRTPTRHLASPLRKKSLPRYGNDRNDSESQLRSSRMSPDLFNNYVQFMGSRAPMHDLRTSSLLSEDFDDILTVTTSDTTTISSFSGGGMNQEEMVIVDYPEITIPDHPDESDFLKPASSKSSLINRFLRNVTQKKIMEATIALNKKLVSGSQIAVANGRPVVGSLYVRGVRPMNKELIEDLNAEIAMEIEQSKSGGEGGGERQEEMKEKNKIIENRRKNENSRENLGNGYGVGELPVDAFRGVPFPFIGALLPEFLMKVFKLYIGYNREGIMTPVLVFLTNKTLYVTDLVRSTLCTKFVMPYSELDVILLGPYGNTVLLCNGARDMQQVLLAGGPSQADALVASLELCARRGGLQLPSIGQLTLDHLAPLQNFVRESSKTVDRREKWLYYAVVSISPMANSVAAEAGFAEVQEQLGANINGPLMHRSLNKAGKPATQWSASYFLLKAGVLYMFPTTTAAVEHQQGTGGNGQKLPTWAVTLTECQGVRRMMNADRPHCVELLLKTGALQLAGADENAASDWMQALVQSASGLFELEERRSHYGCTLVLTSSHIVTLREDFTEPLKRVAMEEKKAVNGLKMAETKSKGNGNGNVEQQKSLMSSVAVVDSDGGGSSTVSTPSHRMSGGGSGLGVRKKSGVELLQTSSINGRPKEAMTMTGGYGKMFSEYGKDAGMEILSCADIAGLISVKVSERDSVWWCSLEFSCQECVQENSDDVVVHFATESEHERFLSQLKEVWRVRVNDVEEFPLQRVADEGGDSFAEHCTRLFTEINRMWDPLVTAALGYPK